MDNRAKQDGVRVRDDAEDLGRPTLTDVLQGVISQAKES